MKRLRGRFQESLLRKTALISTVLLLLSILGLLLNDVIHYSAVGWVFVGLCAFGITSVVSWSTIFLGKILGAHKKYRNTYLLFGITDIVLGMALAAYGVYDILTDTGFLAGIAGWFVIGYLVPVFLLLLVADTVVYFHKSDKEKK